MKSDATGWKRTNSKTWPCLIHSDQFASQLDTLQLINDNKYEPIAILLSWRSQLTRTNGKFRSIETCFFVLCCSIDHLIDLLLDIVWQHLVRANIAAREIDTQDVRHWFFTQPDWSSPQVTFSLLHFPFLSDSSFCILEMWRGLVTSLVVKRDWVLDHHTNNHSS